MQPGEVQLAIDWAAEEGWNPGLHDAACFWVADPHGFLLAEVQGEPVGCIGAVTYGEAFGFIGLYIVAPAWRSRGIGLCLWRAAMSRLAGRVVGLDGVPTQQEIYRRSGFARAWTNARFTGLAAPLDRMAPPEVVPLSRVDFDAHAVRIGAPLRRRARHSCVPGSRCPIRPDWRGQKMADSPAGV